MKKKLVRGELSIIDLDRLLDETKIRSPRLIESIYNYLVDGLTQDQSLVDGLNRSNLIVALKRLEEVENKLKLLGE